MTATPDASPAAVLRAAAAKLRKLTGQATPAPWTTTWNGQQYELQGPDAAAYPIAEWTYAIATWEPQASVRRAECDTANADYIAAMHPGVGRALADWLEREAQQERYTLAEFGHRSAAPEALALARQILQGGTTR